jgi:hypothetical protein
VRLHSRLARVVAPGLRSATSLKPASKANLFPAGAVRYRPGMTEREELLFTLCMALRAVPPGIFRDLGKRRLPGDDLPEKIAAEKILAHLERTGLELKGRLVHTSERLLILRAAALSGEPFDTV